MMIHGTHYPKIQILCPNSIQYSITTWKEIEHLDKNTFAFFMELLWKELSDAYISAKFVQMKWRTLDII